MTHLRLGDGLRLRPFAFYLSHVEFGVAIDAGYAMGHPPNRYTVNPAFQRTTKS